MVRSIGDRLDYLIDHYLVVCIFLSLFILTWVGVGNIPASALLGLILCAAGLLQQSAQVDLWILVPLILYNLISMASSYATYGNIVEGYGAMQSVFPVIYLLMACLTDRELYLLRQMCAVWAGAVAAAGVSQFVWQAVTLGSAGRLEGFLGNANAMGIFLVIGWFSLMQCVSEGEEKDWNSFLIYIEPILLIGLAMTLSMGSFAAMAAGILVVLTAKKKQCSYKDLFPYACRILAKASLGMGTGILTYLAAARTGVPWSCLPLFLYGLVLVRCWRKFGLFLRCYPKAAALIAVCGLLAAGGTILIRPSSIATFSERLEMMGNGLSYLTQNPVLGVGPYQWRLLNLNDGHKYFNTWHIHNILLHVGVEFGWIAMAMLIVIVVRCCMKKTEPWTKAGFTAFCFHNMIDTSFFYMGIMALNMMTTGNPHNGGRKKEGPALKILFSAFAVMFAMDLYYYIGMT